MFRPFKGEVLDAVVTQVSNFLRVYFRFMQFVESSLGKVAV